MPDEIERRRAPETATRDRQITGYAAVYGARSADLGGFVETVAPGAFTETLRRGDDCLALWNHDANTVLGRRNAETLTLADDPRGLLFAIDVPDTTAGRDALVSVGRGDVTGASFAFRVVEDAWDFSGDVALRTLVRVDLVDITLTAIPAYADTEVALRSLSRAAPMTRVQRRRRYVDLLGTS